ncbi:hypothetical protein CVIRNUC_007332 [Coccomyxa viridis]|uniref:Uncharacterized protein n=1 Tax=Coccomyxa viridis TaxID=1274662 RepID=A0AAV1IDQ2_9CHLO|nr:hypothetical protein CVIRNUC_007332 [Coccomyxa viridis]
MSVMADLGAPALRVSSLAGKEPVAYKHLSVPAHDKVHRWLETSSSRPAETLHRRQTSLMQSDDEMQVLRQLYLTMLRALRHQYLDNLLEMQALCSLLCCIHSSAQMGRLQQLKEQHLRPVIKQLQEPKKAILNRQIHRQDVDRLIRLKDLMGPFIQDFSRTAHALRHQAFKVRPCYDTSQHAAAAAA